MAESGIINATNSPAGTAVFRIVTTAFSALIAAILGIVLAYLSDIKKDFETVNRDITDMRIDRATMVGQINAVTTQIGKLHSDVAENSKQLGVINGRVIVLEQNVKVTR